ncbi:GAF domain-containing protein [Fortiea contorta]|uniref:GAF domain-containing protein n=1 Tax=Fortiea contorta TaxID=1892405 RepID=UPI000347E1AE|nr:GAF domain-containing protein [Fortiea contorta]
MNINQSESTAKLTNLSTPYFLTGTEVDEKNSGEQFLLSMYDSVQASIFVVDVLKDGDFEYVALNPTHERWLGMRSEDLRGKKPEDILSPVDAATVRQHYTECVLFGKTISYEQCLQFQGIKTWWSTTLTPLRDVNARIYRLIGTSSKISVGGYIGQSERFQIERERLLEAIARRIRQAQNLETIVQKTVKELRQILESDRLLIYQFQPDGSGIIIAESTIAASGPLLGKNIQDPCFNSQHRERYRRGCIQVIEDIYAAGLHPCQRDFLASLQVRANLVVPILLNEDLWGLLIAQHCLEPHQWEQKETELLKQIAAQIAIAAQQTQLQQQIQNLKAQLQSQLEHRRDYQALLRRITAQIRDNVDEAHILPTVIQELADLWQLDRCQIEIYSPCHTSVTVAYEYTASLPMCLGLTRQIADFPEVYPQLLRKQVVQSVEIIPGWHPKLLIVSQMACPIFDQQGIIGNLWLIRPEQEAFDEFEIALVQQIADECAIAIRRARLQEITQVHVREIEKIEHIKNEFLRTLSHELRTPITSISLAAQTLEGVLTPEGVLDPELVPQLLQILHNECSRGSKLINDLLTLTYLEATPDPQTLITIDLQTWLPPIVESFRELTACQRQQLNLTIETDLPPLQTDIIRLERIFTELLSHVCKHTPSGESITVSANLVMDTVQISFHNSGLEIPAQQMSRIFEPFYRLSKNDPWKYSGTGLELSLVQKMVKHLGGKIHLESSGSETTFIVEFPLGAWQR